MGLGLLEQWRNSQTPSKANRTPARAVPNPTPTTVPVGTPFDFLFATDAVEEFVKLVDDLAVEFATPVKTIVPVSEGSVGLTPKVMVEVPRGVSSPGKVTIEVEVCSRVIKLVLLDDPEIEII